MAEEATDVATDINVEVEEATESNENSEQEDTVVQEEEVVPKKQYNQVFARAKTAEEELKKLKANPPINSNPHLSDELKLIARGLSDEAIEQAKVIARGKGVALTEAIKDPLFLSYQETEKERERKEKAKLGASKGSGESQDSSLIKPEMTREAHQEAFKKVMGQ